MSDEPSNSQVGLDDPTMAFINEDALDFDSHSNSHLSGDDTSQLFDTVSGWDLDGTPPLDTYDLRTTDAFTHAPLDTPDWQFTLPDGLDGLDTTTATTTMEFHGLTSPVELKADVVAPKTLSPQSDIAPGKPRATITLSPAAEEHLRNIAMPQGLHYKSPKSLSSPGSARSDKFGLSPESNEDGKSSARKRKVSSDDDDDDVDDDDKPIKKTTHNMIEKRYRNNINDKIAALRDSVPSLRIMSKSARGEDTTMDREELHGLTPAHKLNKATVLSKATEYIRHLEKRNNRLVDDNATMQARIAAFEKLFLAGAMNGSINSMQQSATPMQYPRDAMQQFNNAPSQQDDSSEMPAGIIQVPEDMRRILAAQMAVGQPYPVPQQQFQSNTPTVVRQQQIQQQQVQQQPGMWANAGPYFGKLMVGSLAGLMIVEAVREEEVSSDTPEGRGLMAVPVQLLRSIGSGLDIHVMGYHIHTSLRLVLCLGVFLWVFVPSLFRPTKKKTKKQCMPILDSAPSLTSSIHVRRQAWLTSVQTVWVPRHNFILEAVALVLKTLKLSLRNVIGQAGYQALTGSIEDHEIARIKAWSIALDSQLAGGDVEVCRSRLILTLMASCTLPDTPIRLMLRALHVHIVLLRLSQQRYQFGVASVIASKVAQTWWNRARQLNTALTQLREDPEIPHDDELPDYLSVLVQQDCEDVLCRAVVQRARNLTFNLHTDHKVEEHIDGMNAVVDDVYISSPMDAVAAWWSTKVLHQAMTAALDEEHDTMNLVSRDVELAINATPYGSIAMLRATLARAVLVDSNRGSNIASALQALGSDRIETPFSESQLIIGSGAHASNKDLLLALRCAVSIAHLKRSEASQLSHAQNLRAVEAMMTAETSSVMTLLGFTGVMKLIECAMSQKSDSPSVDTSLGKLAVEKLSGNLRLWIGGTAGTQCGIDAGVRDQVVGRCLAITKDLVGMELDTGYGSLSDAE